MKKYVLLILLLTCGCQHQTEQPQTEPPQADQLQSEQQAPEQSASAQQASEEMTTTPSPPANEPVKLDVELSQEPGVSIKRLPDDTADHTILFMPDGTFQARADLSSILAYLSLGMLRDDNAIPAGSYAVSASAPENPITEHELRQQVWQRLTRAFEQSFPITIRDVEKEEDVYVLQVANAEMLGKHVAQESDPQSWGTASGGYEFRNQTCADLVTFLTERVQQFVIDETNDEHGYNFHVTINIFKDEVPANWSTALEKVGLSFRQAKRPLSFTAIRKAEAE